MSRPRAEMENVAAGSRRYLKMQIQRDRRCVEGRPQIG